MQLLLSKGAAIDEKDKDGRTALMLASERGHTEAMQLLLGYGAAIDVKDKDGSITLPLVVTFDEDQLGRMAAAEVHRQLLKAERQDSALDATQGQCSSWSTWRASRTSVPSSCAPGTRTLPTTT